AHAERTVDAEMFLVADGPGAAMHEKQHRKVFLSLRHVQVELVLVPMRVLGGTEITVSYVTNDAHLEGRGLQDLLRRRSGQGSVGRKAHRTCKNDQAKPHAAG